MIVLFIDNIYIYEEDIKYIKEKVKENHSIFKIKFKINISTIKCSDYLSLYFLNNKIFTLSKVNKINQDQIDYIYKNCYIDKYTMNKKGCLTITIKNKLSKGELN